jgi:hypothetical protein
VRRAQLGLSGAERERIHMAMRETDKSIQEAGRDREPQGSFHLNSLRTMFQFAHEEHRGRLASRKGASHDLVPAIQQFDGCQRGSHLSVKSI